MSTIIGLGGGGCAVAEKFLFYPQYSVYLIDTEKHPHKHSFLVEAQNSHQAYEESFPNVQEFLERTKPPYAVFVGGSGAISGAILRLLEQIKSKDIDLVYIKPDVDLLSDLRQKQERLTFHVLQQYTRSVLIKNMFIVSNDNCEKLIGDLTIRNFYDKINDLISSTYHMYNVFTNIEPIMQTLSEPLEIARIATLGFVDEKGNENLLYDLQFPREKHYYYSIHAENLENDTKLLSRIKSEIRSRLDGKTRVSYSIFQNDYGQDYIYSVHFASLIQEEKYDFSLDNEGI